MTMTKNQMHFHLAESVCEVTFTKKNGDERVMRCTLLDDYIPESQMPTGNGKVNESDEVIRVFDVEVEGWRSFRIDSVKSFVVQEVV